MVEFLSVLIGLYGGVHPVELAVADEVTAVEIRLDGKTVTVLTAPPWAFDCDFGTYPAPHELVAIARDARGDEIDRAIRWVNLHDSPAAASMSLETDDGGQPVAIRISWESIGVRQPRAVEVLFDGEPLAVADPRRVPLPPFNPDEIHFVSATLRFTDEQVSRLEASFGGALGGEVRTELTAVAVILEKRGALPPAARMQGWFTKDGVPLAVHGVEKGPAEVIFVRDPMVQAELERLSELTLGLAHGANSGGAADTAIARMQQRRYGTRRPDRLRHIAWLGNDVYLQFLAPGAAPLVGNDLVAEMFPHSPVYGAADGGFLRLSQQPTQFGFPMHFAEAVAIAGLAAHGTHRRRAVVALLGEAHGERSQYAAEAVSGYLRQLHVPLAVWRFTGESTQSEWPEARFVGLKPGARKVPEAFEEALADLRRTLQRQRIVWLEGRHLPQEIELSPTAGRIRLAGR
jgi:hypothetical protein